MEWYFAYPLVFLPCSPPSITITTCCFFIMKSHSAESNQNYGFHDWVFECCDFCLISCTFCCFMTHHIIWIFLSSPGDRVAQHGPRGHLFRHRPRVQQSQFRDRYDLDFFFFTTFTHFQENDATPGAMAGSVIVVATVALGACIVMGALARR